MNAILRFLSEPLVHFLLIGAALFAFYQVTNPVPVETGQTIVITQSRLDNLRAEFQATRQRNPSEEEMAAMINNFLREEVLYREAVRLGLDQNDSVVRDRMRQKMEFLADTSAELLTPTDEDLQAVLDENPEAYSQPGQFAFKQVYLGESPSDDMAREVIDQLDAIGDGDGFQDLGQATLLPKEMPLTIIRNISSTFGAEFAAVLQDLEPGLWTGPVRSAYGLHFVYITDETAAQVPDLDDVRDEVASEWYYIKGSELQDAQAEALLGTYDVIIEGDGS